ncbi:hypothetical protein KIH87_13500 [Paraneptunicella aestuarii]|uniref:hypothetical protein n=1 Tax=Paraneptunicella aestuarii TaxID=2831148 RepID=UPI001E3A9F98|nr:hypothetical protein [Paraneptunicella aestuarii]UAA37718.1 hypothetical protein KIH87_13500 [Paraneptunicella aestuarii]
MKNTLSVFSALVLSSMPLLAQAGGNAPPATCYSIPHGEDGQGSTNSLYLPPFLTHGKWTGYVTVTNTSDKYINVRLHFKNYDGSVYYPQSYELKGEFNSSNSPISTSPINSWAIVRPGRSARIGIFEDSYQDVMFGTVIWQTDACIDQALLVAFRSHYSATGQEASTLMLLNDGQPF